MNDNCVINPVACSAIFRVNFVFVFSHNEHVNFELGARNTANTNIDSMSIIKLEWGQQYIALKRKAKKKLKQAVIGYPKLRNNCNKCNDCQMEN